MSVAPAGPAHSLSIPEDDATSGRSGALPAMAQRKSAPELAGSFNKKPMMQRAMSLNSEDLMANTRRDSVRAVLKDMDTDGQVTVEDVIKFIETARDSGKHHDKVMKLFIRVLVLLLFSVVLNGIAMFVIVDMSKDFKPADGSHGAPGELMTKDGDAVKVESSSAFVGTADLPTMPMEYLRALDKISYVSSRGGLTVNTIDGFEWVDANTMTLNLMDGRKIEITPDYSGDDRSSRVATLHNTDGTTMDITESEARRRRLAACEGDVCPNDQKVFSTLEEMKAHVKLLMDEDPVLRRKLSTGTDALSAVYAFFGGIAEGSISAETISRADGPPEAEDSVIVMPLIPTVSKWDISTYDAEAGTWHAGTWYLDVSAEEPKFRIESPIGDDAILVEEVHDGSHYTYQIANAAAIEAMNDGISGTDMTDAEAMCPDADTLAEAGTTCSAYVTAALAATNEMFELNLGLKTTCTIVDESVDEVAAMAYAASAVVQQDNGDGSGVFQVGGWFIKTDTSGTPIELTDGEAFVETIATVSAITDVAGATEGIFDGCTEEQESYASPFEEDDAGSRRQLRVDANMSEEMLAAHDLVDMAMIANFYPERMSEEENRRLSWTSFQAWISDTNWCGAGTDTVNTVCPSSSASGDLTADRACRRHDHGAKSDGIIGGMAVRLGCDIDHGLASATGNWCAQGIFGSWGLAQTWGCFDYGSYSCWNWKSKWWGGYWRYGGYCHGEHNHYGPWRYSSYSHRYGYRAKDKTCAGDIW